jgi:hypothetical protein
LELRTSDPDHSDRDDVATRPLLGIEAELWAGNRTVFTICLGALMLNFGGWRAVSNSLTTDNQVRSFFGIYTISTDPGNSRSLIHGTTVHGLQSMKAGRERDPLTYYAPRSGVGLALANLPPLFGAKARVGIVGLGVGTVSCYARPGQDWRFL